MSKTLNELKDRMSTLLLLRKSEPEGTHYHNDLTLTIDSIGKQINNLEFAKTNPLVMVS